MCRLENQVNGVKNFFGDFIGISKQIEEFLSKNSDIVVRTTTIMNVGLNYNQCILIYSH